jgi:hypothetical protein
MFCICGEAILEAAEEVFAREGFAGARIDTIGAEAGYHKSLISTTLGIKRGCTERSWRDSRGT